MQMDKAFENSCMMLKEGVLVYVYNIVCTCAREKYASRHYIYTRYVTGNNCIAGTIVL